jgi:uncharacterized protein (DUF433 family)
MTDIVDHRIAGTRITVWDVFHHLENGWQNREIAEVLGVTQVQVQVALDYISEHEGEVRRTHEMIEQRNARGNSTDVQSRLQQARAKRLAWVTGRQPVDAPEANCVGHRT